MGGGGGKEGKNSKLGSGVGEVTGRRPTNLYITINKLVEQFTVASTTIQGGASQVREEIAKALLTAVNDVNLIAE